MSRPKNSSTTPPPEDADIASSPAEATAIRNEQPLPKAAGEPAAEDPGSSPLQSFSTQIIDLSDTVEAEPEGKPAFDIPAIDRQADLAKASLQLFREAMEHARNYGWNAEQAFEHGFLAKLQEKGLAIRPVEEEEQP